MGEQLLTGENSKSEWVKAAVLHEMLLEIQDYTNKEVELSRGIMAEGGLHGGEPEKGDKEMDVTPNIKEVKEAAAAEKPMELVNGRPVFTITPPPPYPAEEGTAVSSPGEVSLGMNGSDASSKADPNGLRSRDSRESLIPEVRQERWYTILSQVCIPFMIAGFGMVGAGLILEQMQHLKVFKHVTAFTVLTTPLIGLKGNLEMTLASRLSTHSNLGHMDTSASQWQICAGNLALTQVQAIVVGFLAAVVSMLLAAIDGAAFQWNNAVLLCAASLLTAALASCVLGVLMVGVIVVSKKFNVNPDNIATPIAASLGDVITLGLLGWLGSLLFDELDSKPWLCPTIIAGYVIVTPLWGYISYKNEYTRKVLSTGWPPVIIAMFISTGGGSLLDQASKMFDGIALYQPVINGVGGNLVSVQASRISTSLHRDCRMGELPGTLPGGRNKVLVSPWTVFGKMGVHSTAARVLLGITIPGHLLFATITHFVSNPDAGSQYSAFFLFVYICAAVIQVAILLYIAQLVINFLWVRKLDPDTSTIPYMTALGDLFGTGLLFVSFLILRSSNKI